MSTLSKEEIDRLTPWLLSNLHSEDLDAKDMADYVLSLVTAPGTQEQLYARCQTELQEFMGDQTNKFVDALFQEIARLRQSGNASTGVADGQLPDASAAQTNSAFANTQQQPPDQSLSGGQQEFRRNFRSDFTPFTPQQPHQQPHQHQPFQHQHQQQMQSPFPPPQNFPGFPMPPQGMPPFPGMPSQNGMPPQFGFQGFGAPQGRQPYGRNAGNHNNKHNQRRMHSSLSSIQNELSVANRRLVIEHIPAENLNKESVEQFFGRFGRITDVKINDQQSLAEIEFEGHDQAVEAHKSPEPIFGNRFVKVFWRKRSESEEEPQLDVEAVRRMQAIKQQQFEEREAKRKTLTASLRNLMNEQGEVLQQRQQALQSGQPDPEVLKQLQLRSEDLSNQLKQTKQDLAVLQGSSGPSSAGGPPRRGNRGRGAAPYSRGGRAPRGSFRGGYGQSPYMGSPVMGGGANKFQGASLDRRPKAVLIKGVSAEKDEVLRGELASRNYLDYQRQSDDSVVVDFADRRSAEEFYGHEIPELGEVAKNFVRVEPKQANPDSSMDDS